MLQAGKSIYLYVTINDGHVTSKTQVWAKVEGPGGGRKPGGGGGIPSKFLPPILRPPLPLPPSIPVNGPGSVDGVPAIAFVPSNNKPPLTRTSSARPSTASKVPTARPTPVVTQKAVTATTEASTTPTGADQSTSPMAAEASTSLTVANQSTASTISADADQSTTATATAVAVSTVRPNETRNVTETAASPPTVTTQQPAQNNMILALVPIAVAAVFLTAAGVLACLFRKRLFSAKVKSKKVNSIVSSDQLRGTFTYYFRVLNQMYILCFFFHLHLKSFLHVRSSNFVFTL